MFSRNFLDLKCSKIDLQIEFGDNFYTILNYFDPCVSLDPSKLSGKPEILLKYVKKHILKIPNLGSQY